MKINYYGVTIYSGDDSRAKWVLKYYWGDNATVECRYFATQKEAQRFALKEGYRKEQYIITKNK